MLASVRSIVGGARVRGHSLVRPMTGLQHKRRSGRLLPRRCLTDTARWTYRDAKKPFNKKGFIFENTAYEPYQAELILLSISTKEDTKQVEEQKKTVVLGYFDEIRETMTVEATFDFLRLCSHRRFGFPVEEIFIPIVKHLRQRPDDLKGVNQRIILSTLGVLERTGSSELGARMLLELLLEMLDVSVVHTRPSEKELGLAFTGLKKLDPQNFAVSKLLLRLTDILHETDEFVTKNPHIGSYMKPVSLVNMLCGLQSMSSDVLEVRQLLKAMEKHFIYNREAFSTGQVCMAMYGLRCMSSEHYEVRNMIIHLTTALRHSRGKVDARDIASAIASMRSFRSECSEALALLRTLTQYVERLSIAGEFMNGTLVCEAMSGLRGMSSNSARVREAVYAILTHLKAHLNRNSNLSRNNFRTIFSGMQRMSSNSLQIRQMLGLLTEQLRYTKVRLEHWDIVVILSGLQMMSSHDSEVRDVLDVIHAHIKRCRKPFNEETLTGCIYALRQMDSQHTEVRQLLACLLPHFKTPNGGTVGLRARHISACLHSLLNSNGDVDEIRSILREVTPLLSVCSPPLSPSEVQMSLMGLQRMSIKQKEVQDAIQGLSTHVKLHDARHMRWTAEELTSAFNSVKKMTSVGTLLSALGEEVISCEETIKPAQLATMVRALNRVRGECVDERNALDALATRISKISPACGVNRTADIENSTDVQHFTGEDIERILYGIANMSSEYPEVRHMLAVLKPHLSICREGMSDHLVSRCERLLRAELKARQCRELLEVHMVLCPDSHSGSKMETPSDEGVHLSESKDADNDMDLLIYDNEDETIDAMGAYMVKNII